MKYLACILALLSSAAIAGPSPSEQLATGKGYYYGTDRDQHSGFACFWLKSAELAGADASSFERPACNDAKRKGYDPGYLEQLAEEYQKTGKAPAEEQLVEQYMQAYDGMPQDSQATVADSPAPRFDATNTAYKESDAYSRVPIEVQIEQAEQQQAQQQAAQQAYQAQQTEQLIALQQQQIRLQQEQLAAQQAEAEKARRREKRREIRERFDKLHESNSMDCKGRVDDYGYMTATCD